MVEFTDEEKEKLERILKEERLTRIFLKERHLKEVYKEWLKDQT